MNDDTTREDTRTVLQRLRAFVPERGLEYHEARIMAERQATMLLDILSQYEPPVDVSLIGELPRVEVKVVRTQAIGGLSGLTHWDRTKACWLIAINRDDSRTRRRFSLGHEFKHVLDRHHDKVLYPARLYRQDSERVAEKMCDVFAASFLASRPWVKRLWASGMQDASELAAVFNVSPAAMSWRLKELGLVNPSKRWQGGEYGTPRTYFRKSPAFVE